MSHWHDEVGKVILYTEQVILGSKPFEQKKFVEAVKILQEVAVIFHDYAHVAGKKKGISDNPDHSCMGSFVSPRARTLYERAKGFNKAEDVL